MCISKLLLVICIHRLSLWQREDKLCADAGRADDIYVFFVGLNDLFYNCKTKPCSLLILTSGQIGFIKSVKDKLLVFLGNTDSAVLDGNKYFAVLLGSLDLDGRIFVTEFDCIVHKIVEHLLDLTDVCVYDHRIVG